MSIFILLNYSTSTVRALWIARRIIIGIMPIFILLNYSTSTVHAPWMETWTHVFLTMNHVSTQSVKTSLFAVTDIYFRVEANLGWNLNLISSVKADLLLSFIHLPFIKFQIVHRNYHLATCFLHRHIISNPKVCHYLGKFLCIHFMV